MDNFSLRDLQKEYERISKVYNYLMEAESEMEDVSVMNDNDHEKFFKKIKTLQEMLDEESTYLVRKAKTANREDTIFRR